MKSPARSMVWAFLLLIGVIVGVQWWEYSRAVQEYSFAQPAGMDVGAVLTEKTPIVVEIGPLPWRPAVATSATWTLEDGRRVSEWLEDPKEPVNLTGVAEQADLVTGLADLDAGRPWWWLPGLHTPKVGVLRGGAVRGLNWVTAERRWFGCSHGAPMRVWLVHSRYRRYLPTTWCDPWTLTVAEAPWIGRVQFVEVVVKPGWCIGVPAHWGFAVRSESGGEGAEGADSGSWWWRVDQHSLASAAVASKGAPSVGENESRVSAV